MFYENEDEEVKENLFARCRSREDLRKWVRVFTSLRLPLHAVCAHHQAPLEYLWHTYHEPATDVVVWAPRGGGKTRLAALATLLDLLHKPGCAVRILGGSLEQSMKMWDYLRQDIQRLVPDMLASNQYAHHSIRLNNNSNAAALAQSERAVRGLHVQKLRCDEVEMFYPGIWEAAQLVTRSMELPQCGTVSGAIEAISTHHKLGGLMGKIIDRAKQNATPVIRWCFLEVLEKCPASRDCATCPLWDECRGIAKTRCDGFLKVDDVIRHKLRVSADMWDSEMLCNRPSRQRCVFPTFAEEVHVCRTIEMDELLPMALAIDFGFNSPFVCLWIRDDGTRCFVVDEYVQTQRTLGQNMSAVESREWGKASRICCDPAGNGRSDQTARSNVQILKSMGYKVQQRTSRIVDGLELLRAAIDPALPPVKLFVHPNCVRLIAALKQYRYPDNGGEIPLKDGEHDHLVDALRYYYVNRGCRPAKSRAY